MGCVKLPPMSCPFHVACSLGNWLRLAVSSVHPSRYTPVRRPWRPNELSKQHASHGTTPASLPKHVWMRSPRASLAGAGLRSDPTGRRLLSERPTWSTPCCGAALDWRLHSWLAGKLEGAPNWVGSLDRSRAGASEHHGTCAWSFRAWLSALCCTWSPLWRLDGLLPFHEHDASGCDPWQHFSCDSMS